MSYILLFIVVIALPAGAQHDGESLRSKASRGQEAYSGLLDSARYYLRTDADRSIRFIEDAMRVLNRSKFRSKASIARAYVVLGDVYFYWKAFDLATSNYKEALDASPDNRDEVMLKLARSYYHGKNYQQSQSLIRQLQKRGRLKSARQVMLWELLGDNQKALRSSDSALESYAKGLKIAQKRGLRDEIISLNSKIAAIYSAQGDFNNAELNLQNSISVAQQQSVQQEVAQNQQLADLYRGNKQFDKEISVRKNSLEQIEKLPQKSIDSLSSQSINYDIADAYVEQRRYKEAIPFLNRSIEDATKSRDLETKKNAVQRLSEVYKEVGEYDKALTNYQKYVELVDLLYAKKEKEIENAASFSKTLALKQNRIDILEKDRQLSEKERKLTRESYRKQQLLIYFLIAGLLLLAGVLHLMYKSNQQKKLANNLLALKSLRTQMNPHFIFNALNSVNSFIAQSDERTANKYLTDFSNLMRSVLENSEKDFIPLSREIELIQLYLKLEHSRFVEKFDYSFEVDSNVKVADFSIPPMLVQPYIENAIWHGLRYKKDKGKLDISIRQKGKDTLMITITDNGIGRKKSRELKTENQLKKKSKAMGNISSRIDILNEMYGGKIRVSVDDLRGDGGGTVVLLVIERGVFFEPHEAH